LEILEILWLTKRLASLAGCANPASSKLHVGQRKIEARRGRGSAHSGDETEHVLNSQISYPAASASYKAGNYTQALAIINRLLELNADARTYALLGKTLAQIGFKEEACKAYLAAAEKGGNNAGEHLVEAIRLNFELGNKDEALALSSRLQPKQRMDPDVAFVLGSILYERNNLELAGVFKSVLLKSDNIDYLKLGIRITSSVLDVTKASEIDAVYNVLKRMPADNQIRLLYLTFCREHNKYDAIKRHQPIVEKAIAAGETDFLKGDSPFSNINWCGDEAINRLATRNTSRFDPAVTAVRRAMPHRWGQKIRIGYVSSDLFDQHATMKLIRRVLELHDRNQFEITLFCHTKPEVIAKNRADRSAWGDVVSILDMTTEQAVDEIRRREIDILVDLKGHTHGNRTVIFNHPAAPVHVTWIGFPGTVSNVDLDYAIGDPIVLPMSSAPFYREKFCRLPDTYQPNDPVNRPLPEPMTRKQAQLPEETFIFGSFNAPRKISLSTITAWIHILKRTPGSAIAIVFHSEESRGFIRKKMADSGIAANRVLFMHKMDFQLHINRIPLVDLGLDTFPYNGHTTTSEQLWAGLPVLTVKGTNFASRVSESLLGAIGTPELVAETLDDYVDRAVHFFNNPGELQQLRARIEANRLVSPLFDADRFRQHLETGYRMMADRARAGLEPDHIDVPALPARMQPFMQG
jgi:tetratricopeptide (TPR) repeat protein